MEKKYTEEMAKAEAILYALGGPVSLSELCAYLKLDDEREVAIILNKISNLLKEENSALEILKLPKDRVVLQLKTDFTKEATRFSTRPLLTYGPLKTLSFVAYNQPIDQVDVAKIRGSHAYKHLKMLEEMGLITRKKKGRTKMIRTTQDFADYLGLSYDNRIMKKQLVQLFKKLEIHEIDKK